MSMDASRLATAIATALDSTFGAWTGDERQDACAAIASAIVTEIDTTAQDAWSTASLAGAWNHFGAPYANAGYYKDAEGRVHLRGAVASGAVGSTIFTLPAGSRPPFTIVVPIATWTGAAWTFGAIAITSAGVVALNLGGTSIVFLDGISFRTT